MATDQVLLLLQEYLKINESPHNKTSKMTFAASEDSDQPVHLLSLISLCCSPEESSGPLASLRALSKDSDQTGPIPRLIRVFAGCISHFVVFCHALAQLNRHPFNDRQITEATAPTTCSRHARPKHMQCFASWNVQKVWVGWNGSKFWKTFKCKQR